MHHLSVSLCHRLLFVNKLFDFTALFVLFMAQIKTSKRFFVIWRNNIQAICEDEGGGFVVKELLGN